MKLYCSPGACSLAVHVLLEGIGRPRERERASIFGGKTRLAPSLSVNPLGRVPALAVAGAKLRETAAIATYFVLANPER